jgi:hypothetical protein
MKTKKKQSKNERKTLYEKHGHLIPLNTNELPEKHRAKTGGLRCFGKIKPRDEHGNKLQGADKVRCGRSCAKGSLYCRFHGGGNSHNLVHGERKSAAQMAYKGSYSAQLGDVLEAFMSDPKLMDLKPELAMLRTIFMNYVQKINDNEAKKKPRSLINMIQKITDDDDLDDYEKWISIREVVNSQQTLHDGHVVDRVIRCAEAIGKQVERIDKITSRKEMLYTQDGLKILLRAITDLINNVFAEQPEKLSEFRGKLLTLSTETGNNISELNRKNQDASKKAEAV